MLKVSGFSNMMMSTETDKMILKNTLEVSDHSVVLLDVIGCD